MKDKQPPGQLHRSEGQKSMSQRVCPCFPAWRVFIQQVNSEVFWDEMPKSSLPDWQIICGCDFFGNLFIYYYYFSITPKVRQVTNNVRLCLCGCLLTWVPAPMQDVWIHACLFLKPRCSFSWQHGCPHIKMLLPMQCKRRQGCICFLYWAYTCIATVPCLLISFP